MDKKIAMIVLGLLVVSVLAFKASSAEVYGSIDMSIYSSYYARGMLIDDTPVIQPYVTVCKEAAGGTFMFNVYGNMEPEKYTGNENTFNEMDIFFGYSRKIDKLTLNGGLAEYTFSNPEYPDTDSHEVYMGASYEMPSWCPVTPSMTVYYDFKEADGFLVNATLSHLFTISEKTTLTADTLLEWADASYNEYNFTVYKNALNDWSSGLTLAYTPIKSLTLTTGVRYGMLVDDEIKEGSAAYYSDSDALTFRAGMTYNF
jgi:hypothetical protein